MPYFIQSMHHLMQWRRSLGVIQTDGLISLAGKKLLDLVYIPKLS